MAFRNGQRSKAKREAASVPRSRCAPDRSSPLPGLWARVVSGYLYGHSTAGIGAGTTHAWADVYVPGSGWIAYDPTNGAIDSSDLIRVAVTRDIDQAVPVAGSFVGASDSYLGMTVDVAVTPESNRRMRTAPAD
jgi:transglutaminase superfamily protein